MSETNFLFNIICITETWCSNDEIKSNSNLHLPNFEIIPLERKIKKRGGGVLIYIKKNLDYTIRNDLSVSDGDKEIVTVEFLNKDSKNILLSCCNRPPAGDSENLSMFLKNELIEKSILEKKKSFIIGDFILNCLT